MSILGSITGTLGKVGSLFGYIFTAIEIVEKIGKIFKGGEKPSGQEKHDAAVELVREAIATGEFIAKKDVVDEAKFSEGLDQVIHGIVAMLNASWWYKKAALFVVIGLALFSMPAMAADLTFAWDNPTGQAWNNVRIYEIAGGNYALKAEVTGNATTATVQNVPPGNHVYIARSYMNGVESADSNQVSQEIKPGLPVNFRIVAVNIDDQGNVTFRLMDPLEFFRTHAG